MTTVAISEASRKTLEDIALQTGESMDAVLRKAIEAYRRQAFFDRLDADYAALRSDPAAWAQFEKERGEWDTTLMDGLDPNENWSEDGVPNGPSSQSQGAA